MRGVCLLAMTIGVASVSLSDRSFAQPAKAPSNTSPFVSPDGKKVYFSGSRDGVSARFVVNADGTGQRTVLAPGVGPFAPDGKSMWISGKAADSGKVFLATIDRNVSAPVATVLGRAPTMSPDGLRVAYLSGPWTSTAVVVSRADGSDARRIAGGSTTAWNPAWSPDGRRIAYTYGAGDSNLQVHIVNADGTGDHAVTTMTPDEGSAQMPSWSPDGRRLAVQVGASHGSHIWIVDLQSGKATRLGPHEGYLDEIPRWFPDGKRVAFQSNRTGTWEIFVMNADGTGVRQLSHTP